MTQVDHGRARLSCVCVCVFYGWLLIDADEAAVWLPVLSLFVVSRVEKIIFRQSLLLVVRFSFVLPQVNPPHELRIWVLIYGRTLHHSYFFQRFLLRFP